MNPASGYVRVQPRARFTRFLTHKFTQLSILIATALRVNSIRGRIGREKCVAMTRTRDDDTRCFSRTPRLIPSFKGLKAAGALSWRNLVTAASIDIWQLDAPPPLLSVITMMMTLPSLALPHG